MRFLVYGAGALGQALGCMLACDGHTVDMILRPRFIDTISQNGLHVSGIFGSFTAPPENLGLLTNVHDSKGGYDYVLLTTKSYDTQESVEQLALLPNSEQSYFVSLQNGCGNIEILSRKFGVEQTIGGRVITGFEISKPGEVAVTVSADDIHVGNSVSGSISQAVTELAEMLTRAGHPCLAVPDIHKSLHAKLLYNCALNPLGAVLGVNYGPLAERDETREIMNHIIDETFAVISATGGTTPWADASDYKKVFYETLVPVTANHRPSMLQDLENNKPTEVDALVGYVSARGRETGIPTPTCNTLGALVKFREHCGYRKGEHPGADQPAG